MSKIKTIERATERAQAAKIEPPASTEAIENAIRAFLKKDVPAKTYKSGKKGPIFDEVRTNVPNVTLLRVNDKVKVKITLSNKRSGINIDSENELDTLISILMNEKVRRLVQIAGKINPQQSVEDEDYDIEL